MKRILFVAAILALLLSACGPQATPTIDPAQVQASAIAAANTMVAMTLAAVPTATPIPPTPVPSPTLAPLPTPIPLPTLPVQSVPTAKSGGTSDPCNGLMDIKASGRTTPVSIKNLTNGRITVSFYSPKNAFGQCGYVVAQVGPRDSATTNLPLSSGGACWGVYAIINDPSRPSKAVGGPFCLNTVSTWALTIDYGSASMGR